MALFSHGSPFMRFMERLVDVLLLNLLWIAFSLPVVTIGASTAAAFAVALKMADDEEGYILKPFVKAFKANFLQGTALWTLNALALYALYLSWQFALKSDDLPLALIIACVLSTILFFCAFVYAYPQAARYRNKTPAILLNSFRIATRYPGKTLLLVLVLALEIFLFSWNLPMAVFGVLSGPMILIYTVAGVSLRIFRDIEKKNGASPSGDVPPSDETPPSSP